MNHTECSSFSKGPFTTLEVLEVLDDALAEPRRRLGHLEVGRLKEVRPRPDLLPPLREPLPDEGRGDVEVRRQLRHVDGR